MKTTVERMYVEAMESAMSSIKLPANQAQINGASGREYTKLNQLILVSSQASNKFQSNEWFTQEQVKEAGLSVIKDSKGTQLFSSNIKEDENKTYTDRETGEVKKFKIKTYSYYFVFNKDQLEKAQ